MTNTLSTLAVLLTALAPAAGSDEAIPGRDGNYEFDAVSLVGTVWEGKLVYDDTSIIRVYRLDGDPRAWMANHPRSGPAKHWFDEASGTATRRARPGWSTPAT